MHRILEDLGKTRILPQTLAKSLYAYKLYTTPPLHVIALYQIKTLIIVTRKLFSRSSASDRSTISGKYDRWGVAYMFTENWQSPVLSRSNIIRTLPIAILLILSFSGTGIWTCVSLRITTSELKEAKYLFLKSAATNMRSSARPSMSRFTCRTHLSLQSTMNYICVRKLEK